MKLNNNNDHAISVGVSQTSGFTIKANAHAFKILSDGLYTNKILAVMRELAANAVDSHVAAGKGNMPIDVKLPVKLDNTFYVQDYGTGLSDEQVFNLYTTYFDSTKQESNDFVGAFGLGSKSPFSYTDQFTVESIYSGVRSCYVCYLDNGLPKVSKVYSEDTNESSGLKVSFDVKLDDCDKFREAVSAFTYYKVFPNLINDTGVVGRGNYIPNDINRKDSVSGKITFINVHLSDGDWLLQSNSTKSQIVQGGVTYPVDFDILNQHGMDQNVIRCFDRSSGVVVCVPIGSVQVSASREGLSYDKHTCEYLISVYNQLYDTFFNIIQSDVNSCTTKWDAMCTINKYTISHPVISTLVNAAKFSWGNELIMGRVNLSLSMGDDYVLVQHISTHYKTVKSSDTHKLFGYIDIANDIKVYVGDYKSPSKHIRDSILDHNTKSVLYITGSDAGVANILKQLGNPHYNILNKNTTKGKKSKGQSNAVITRQPAKYVKKVVVDHTNGTHDIYSHNHKDLPKFGVYITRCRDSTSHCVTTTSNILKLIGGVTDFYIVTQAFEKKLPKDWVHINNFIKHNIANNQEFKHRLMSYCSRYNHSNKYDLLKKLYPTNIRIIDNLVVDMGKIPADIAYEVYQYVKTHIDGYTFFNSEYDRIYRTYKLLDYFSSYINAEKKSDIIEYLNIVNFYNTSLENKDA